VGHIGIVKKEWLREIKGLIRQKGNLDDDCAGKSAHRAVTLIEKKLEL
jgi:hypothetical protein